MADEGLERGDEELFNLEVPVASLLGLGRLKHIKTVGLVKPNTSTQF